MTVSNREMFHQWNLQLKVFKVKSPNQDLLISYYHTFLDLIHVETTQQNIQICPTETPDEPGCLRKLQGVPQESWKQSKARIFSFRHSVLILMEKSANRSANVPEPKKSFRIQNPRELAYKSRQVPRNTRCIGSWKHDFMCHPCTAIQGECGPGPRT